VQRHVTNRHRDTGLRNRRGGKKSEHDDEQSPHGGRRPVNSVPADAFGLK
jgi:hypothetical protein